jgi:hypothetical protein
MGKLPHIRHVAFQGHCRGKSFSAVLKMETAQSKTTWFSGEICNAAGTYFSDTCSHSIRKEYRANDVFIRCPTCHQTLRWMRFNGKRLGLFRFNGPSAFGINSSGK